MNDLRFRYIFVHSENPNMTWTQTFSMDEIEAGSVAQKLIHGWIVKCCQQLIGLQDKWGVELCHGDILEDEHDIMVIRHMGRGFYLCRNKDGEYNKVTNWGRVKKATRRGNIFESPDLLSLARVGMWDEIPQT